MKKLALILFVSILTVSAVIATPVAFSFSAGYDHQSCTDRDNAANSLGFTLGVRGPLNEYLDYFGSGTLRIGGKFKCSNKEYTDKLAGYKFHAGVIYNVPLRSETLKAGLGVSATFARSLGSEGSGDSKIQYGFSNIGLGLHAVGTYSFNTKYQFMAEANPDVYFINWNTTRQDNKTESTRLSKIGLGFSLKIGFVYAM